MDKKELLHFVVNWMNQHDDEELYTVDDNKGSIYIMLQEY